ncbi:MAG: hypothetical protein NT062_21715, partial [Proteobacteria bacterium]|nr:hypothetical protein [Pseudomonadota bacterium]
MPWPRAVLGVAVATLVASCGAPPTSAPAITPCAPVSLEATRVQLGDVSWAATTSATLARIATAYGSACASPTRSRCVDRAVSRFDALVSATRSLDAASRAALASAALQLPVAPTCDDASAWDAKATAEQHEVDLAWAAFVLGRYREAQSRLDGIAIRTSRFPAPPTLLAAMDLLAAQVDARLGDRTAARRHLDRALPEAASAPALAYQITLELVRLDPSRAPLARAAAARAGLDGGELA